MPDIDPNFTLRLPSSASVAVCELPAVTVGYGVVVVGTKKRLLRDAGSSATCSRVVRDVGAGAGESGAAGGPSELPSDSRSEFCTLGGVGAVHGPSAYSSAGTCTAGAVGAGEVGTMGA